MKKLILILLMFINYYHVIAQVSSENGRWNPVKGQFRVLLVYAEVLNDPNYNLVTQPGWPAGQMPLNPGKYFDSHYSANINGYMTKYFNESSFGEYHVLGDYYPQLIQIDCNTNSDHFGNVISTLNQSASADLVGVPRQPQRYSGHYAGNKPF